MINGIWRRVSVNPIDAKAIFHSDGREPTVRATNCGAGGDLESARSMKEAANRSRLHMSTNAKATPITTSAFTPATAMLR